MSFGCVRRVPWRRCPRALRDRACSFFWRLPILKRIERVFYSDDVANTAADRLLLAQLTGLAKNLAWRRPGTAEELADASAELRDLAGGRADLLAELAGSSIGFAEGSLDGHVDELMGALAIQAGAGPRSQARR